MNALDAEYREGRRLIDEHMQSHSKLSTFDLFRSSWSLIEKNSGKFIGRAIVAGYHESAWRVLVYHDFVKHFTKARPDFRPLVRDLPAPKGPAVMVSIHTGLELGIVKALRSKGKDVSLLFLPSPQARERSVVFRPGGGFEYIRADSDSLLRARIALRNGRVLVADCDYPLPENPEANATRAISKALFELAKRSGVELFFVVPVIDKRGHIEFVHRSDGIPTDAAVARQHLVDFLASSGLGWMRWELP